VPQIPNPGPSFPVFFERETNNGERRQAGSVGGAKIVRVLLALLKKVELELRFDSLLHRPIHLPSRADESGRAVSGNLPACGKVGGEGCWWLSDAFGDQDQTEPALALFTVARY
jgi:hypothetical protein